MVQRVFTVMHKEIRGLHQAAYVLALFTFGSQMLALIRDRLLAHQFGASMQLDLYYTAFRIPDILYVLFASTLSVYVLIPFISEKMEKQSVQSAQVLFSQIFSLFIVLYIGIASVAILFTPYITHILFPGFMGSQETLVLLIRILLLQPLLLGVSSLYGVITQLHHRFILYAVGPLLYNLGIIFGLLVLYPLMGITGLVFGVVLGALGHLGIQLPYVFRTPLMPRFVFSFDFREIIRICRTSFVRALTLSLHQLVLLILIGFASVMSVGSISIFQLGYNLQSVPLAIIGVSYSVAAFPLLAQLYAEKRMDTFGGYIVNTIKHILFWSLPTMTLFIVIRAQFVRVVLGSGKFDWTDTRLTAAVLAIFILSLVGQAIHLLMVRALYATGNTRIPFFVTLFSTSLAVVATFFFRMLFATDISFTHSIEWIMRLEGVAGIEVLALPMGYTLSLIVHSFVILMIGKKYVHLSFRALIKPFLQSTIAGLGAGWSAYVVLNYTVMLFTSDTFWTVLLQGFCAGVVGLCVYIGIQYAFKNEELGEVMRMFKKRLVRKETMVAPQDEDFLSV